MRTVDLSIDFDFFVREEPEWDFGHGESAIMRMLWFRVTDAKITGPRSITAMDALRAR